MIAPSDVKLLLLKAFPDAEVELEDLTGTQDHYRLAIASSAFEAQSPLGQHQLVYRALAEQMRGPIHALALKTYTPSAWANKGND